MKKSFFLLLVLTSLFSSGQNALEFSKVITAENQNQVELFVLVNDWFAVNFKSANDVIQMADKDAGIIIGNGANEYSFGKLAYLCYDGYLNYTIKVQFKDSRFKVDVNNFIHSNRPGNAASCNVGLITTAKEYKTDGVGKNAANKAWDDLKLKSAAIAEGIFIDLEKKITEAKDDDNW